MNGMYILFLKFVDMPAPHNRWIMSDMVNGAENVKIGDKQDLLDSMAVARENWGESVKFRFVPIFDR